MGRRAIKEYRAAEALQLILADRDQEKLVCPSCGSGTIDRTPKRRIGAVPREAQREAYRQVTLKCAKCGRSAAYVPKHVTQPSQPDLSY